ncbi:MAG: bifunctional nicotinamidase/pyrazinamidase [Planctomycetes bacterium]|nr:bifunctional nicotinamidase/pyrazinamidase [Planctomycetota bacterium]
MPEALVVVDVQRDFCPGGALAVPDGDAVVPAVNRLLEAASLAVLTQDWHPADHVSFHVSHRGTAPYETISTGHGEQVLWPVHCVGGTPGADFHPLLASHRAALVLRKGLRRDVDSYSAFVENDRVSTTGLDGFLRARGIDALAVVGLALDYCVARTALDAAALGYRVRVVESACRAIDRDGSGKAARRALHAAGVIVEP